MASPSESREGFHQIRSQESPLHPLHQFNFLVEGQTYICIDQYVLHQKLEACKAKSHTSELFKIHDPAQLRSFEGKLSLVVDPVEWETRRKEATKAAYHAKSKCCKLLFDLLNDTKDKILVYASNAKDAYLGIGVMWNDPLAQRKHNWKGKNLLGEWLMEVREELQKDQTNGDSVQMTSDVGSTETPDDSDNEKFTYFWQDMSPFSQWHPCNFQVDGQWYNSAEQCMMHQKAVTFGDESTAKKILESCIPAVQKRLGREVTNFNEKKWNHVSREIVKIGNLAKFNQNEDLKKALFATKGTTLVEASPRDRTWGIGLSEDDPRAKNRNEWRGENRLGQVLTEVRDELMSGRTEMTFKRNESVGKSVNKDELWSAEKTVTNKGFTQMKRHNRGDKGGPPRHKSKYEAPKSRHGHQDNATVMQSDKTKGSNVSSSNQIAETAETKQNVTPNTSDSAWDGFLQMEVDTPSDSTDKRREKNISTASSKADFSKSQKGKEKPVDTIDEIESGEKFTFFWRAESPFSQHHPAKFHLDGREYNCAEQYMMNQKAVVFGDDEISQQIMDSSNPPQQKALAKQVRGFDDNHWKTLRRDVVKRANIAKFSQNPRLKQMLLETAGTTLVEASPKDETWGIGLNADDFRAWNRRTWQGKNMLGEILTEVREELAKEDNGVRESGEERAENFHQQQSDNYDEQYTVFWRPVSPFHPRYPVGFVLDDIHYWTLLQYLVHQKALLFDDGITARAVMEQKPFRLNKLEELNRKVRHYDQRQWTTLCRSYLRRGNFAKFSQNRNLRQQLIDNVLDGELVYAEEHDRLLGIGLSRDDIRVCRRSSWPGKNLLGQSLMEVRQMIMQNPRSELPEIVENPDDAVETVVSEEVADNIHFFFNKSPFNMWLLCKFSVGKFKYNSAEQYMLHHMALHFQDSAAAENILWCRRPAQMQDVYIANYSHHVWSQVCREIVKSANREKFFQNVWLQEELLKTNNAIIAYALAKDTLLGIGLRDSDPRASNPDNWPGQNILGDVLMEIREELKDARNSRRTSDTSDQRSESQNLTWRRGAQSSRFSHDSHGQFKDENRSSARDHKSIHKDTRHQRNPAYEMKSAGKGRSQPPTYNPTAHDPRAEKSYEVSISCHGQQKMPEDEAHTQIFRADLFQTSNAPHSNTVQQKPVVNEGKVDNSLVAVQGRNEKAEIHVIDPKSSLDLWARCQFSADRCNYWSVAQFMIHQMAVIFDKKETAQEIIEEERVGKLLTLRKYIEDVDEVKWKSVIGDVFKKGNYYKFSQNENLKQELTETSGKVLNFVEKEKNFKLGLGLKPGDKDFIGDSKWIRDNFFGHILMEIREELVSGKESSGKSCLQTFDDVPFSGDSKAADKIEERVHESSKIPCTVSAAVREASEPLVAASDIAETEPRVGDADFKTITLSSKPKTEFEMEANEKQVLVHTETQQAPAVSNTDAETKTELASTPSELQQTPAVSDKNAEPKTQLSSTPSELQQTPAVSDKNAEPKTQLSSTNSELQQSPAVSDEDAETKAVLASTPSELQQTPAVSDKDAESKAELASTTSKLQQTPAVSDKTAEAKTELASTQSELDETPAVSDKDALPKTELASTPSELQQTPSVSDKNAEPKTELASTPSELQQTPAVSDKNAEPKTQLSSTHSELQQSPAVSDKNIEIRAELASLPSESQLQGSAGSEKDDEKDSCLFKMNSATEDCAKQQHMESMDRHDDPASVALDEDSKRSPQNEASAVVMNPEMKNGTNPYSVVHSNIGGLIVDLEQSADERKACSDKEIHVEEVTNQKEDAKGSVMITQEVLERSPCSSSGVICELAKNEHLGDTTADAASVSAAREP